MGGFIPITQNPENGIYQGLMSSVSMFENIVQVSPNFRTGPLSQNILKRHGFPSEALSAAQISGIGYAPSRVNTIPQFQLSVLMKKTNVEDLKVPVRRLSDSIYRYGHVNLKNQFERTIFQVVRGLTGDELPLESSISGFIKRRLGYLSEPNCWTFQFKSLLRKVLIGSFAENCVGI